VVKGDPAEKLLQTLRDLLVEDGRVTSKKAAAASNERRTGAERRPASMRRSVRRRA
jgi:hypothetical protein